MYGEGQRGAGRGVLLTVVPLHGPRGRAARGRLPIELTLWSSPRLQEPLLLQQST